MEKLGIINEITGKKRNRVWVYSSYWQILNDNIFCNRVPLN